MTTERALRMIDSAPIYYQHSRIYENIQEATAQDLELISSSNDELAKQLDIRTATWGLKYWEGQEGITVNEGDANDVRRSRVLGKLRGVGNFSADLIRAITQAYSQEPVTVVIDPTAYQVIVRFIEDFPNIEDFRKQIYAILHAHLVIVYKGYFKYKTDVKPKQQPFTDVAMKVASSPWVKAGILDRAPRMDGAVTFDGGIYFHGFDAITKHPGPVMIVREKIKMVARAPFNKYSSEVPQAILNGVYSFSGGLLMDGSADLSDPTALIGPVRIVIKDRVKINGIKTSGKAALISNVNTIRVLPKTKLPVRHKHSRDLFIDFSHQVTAQHKARASVRLSAKTVVKAQHIVAYGYSIGSKTAVKPQQGISAKTTVSPATTFTATQTTTIRLRNIRTGDISIVQ